MASVLDEEVHSVAGATGFTFSSDNWEIPFHWMCTAYKYFGIGIRFPRGCLPIRGFFLNLCISIKFTLLCEIVVEATLSLCTLISNQNADVFCRFSKGWQR